MISQPGHIEAAGSSSCVFMITRSCSCQLDNSPNLKHSAQGNRRSYGTSFDTPAAGGQMYLFSTQSQLSQAAGRMRLCVSGSNRTIMFHVKQLCPIDAQ